MAMFSTASRPWRLFFAVLLFVTATLAQLSESISITKPLRDEIIPAGSTYRIVWTITSSTFPIVNIDLAGGETQTALSTLQVLATAVDGTVGYFDWTVDKSWGGKLPIFRIQIYWEEPDVGVRINSSPFQISAAGTSAATTLSSIIASSTTATVPTASSSQTISDGGKGEGKSPNSVPVVVPVVLGVVLGLVVLAALGWFLWRRNKKRKKTQGGMVPELGDSGKDKADQYGGVGELPAHERPVEVSGEGARRVELE